MLDERRCLRRLLFAAIVGTVTVIIYEWSNRTFASSPGSCSTNSIDTSREDDPESIDMATRELCQKRLPTAIIVGIQKAGTTTLLSFLFDHPHIANGGTGEPQYFSKHYDKPLEWYRQLMPCSYSYETTIEKSPPYFLKQDVPERIRKMNPNTKIIVIVKEPIERAMSMYGMLVGLNDEYVKGKSFKDAIMREDKVDKQSPLIGYSTYPRHMKRWLDVFNRDQILILDGNKFITDPSVELRKVEKFLDIGHYFTPDRFMFNETKNMYCIIKSGVPSCMGPGKGHQYPAIDTDVRLKLQKYFKPLNEQFFQMIGMRFEWGY